MIQDSQLLKFAGAIADGAAVDWAQAEAGVDTPELQDAIRQLRIVAGVAAVHRTVPDLRPETSEPSMPRFWGHLELRSEIGKGSFGTVYVAWDSALEREVALKLLRRSNLPGTMLREARMLARVRHPNVVTVYGANEHAGALGVWMERIAGASLTQYLSTHGELSARETALIGIDLCRALAAVHRAGILHRDIKAPNVMREASTGRIVLMDFGAGAVRRDDGPIDRQLTGTPLYLAPEVLRGEPASIASDIYSLGVLLFHLVTLRFPIEGRTIEAVREAHGQARPARITDLRPDVPAWFARVIDCAIDAEPARRYRSAGAMQSELLAGALELPERSAPFSGARFTGVELQTPSIAVLPFVNLGPDQDLEYLCNGLAEELLTGLGKVSGLRVASRTSSFAFADISTDIRSICRQLNVSAVLEGTVRKSGEQLRINAQLVSAEDGCHLWSEGFDCRMQDVFAVQDSIATSVVDRLKIRLGDSMRRPLIRTYTDNPKAYEHYLKGRFYWLRRYQGGLRSALDHFDKALVEDAGYALAHAGRADAFVFVGFYFLQQPRAAFAQASRAVQQALAIDPDLPEAHTSLALIRLGDDWNWVEAAREFKRALELDPDQVLARIYSSWLMVLSGDSEGAIANARAAQQRDPMSPLVNSGAAYTLFLARRYEEAARECEKALEFDPNFIIAMYIMGMCRAQQARLSEAAELLERAVVLSDRAPFYLALLGNVYGRSGAASKALELIGELEHMRGERYVTPHCWAYVYAGMNDIDRAIEWEQKAFDDGASPFTYFSPILENLHGDPRHQAELRRMGLRT